MREVEWIHSSDNVGASEWLVTAGRIKRQLCEGIMLWWNPPICEINAQIK